MTDYYSSDNTTVDAASTASAAPPPLSQSMYEAMGCPASYQAVYAHGVESLPNEFSILGQEPHRCMSLYTKHLVAAELDADWAYFESILGLFSSEAQTILRGFIGSMRFDWRAILTTEMRFEDEDAAGTPDLVTMETPVDATIWDYKNYFEIIEANTFQSKLYPLLLFRHNPALETVRFVLVFLRYGATREVTWSRDQLPYLERILKEARARQLGIHQTEGLAQAIPGKACTYCPLLATARCQVNDWNPRASMSDADRLLYVIYLQAALRSSQLLLRDSARFKSISAQDANGKVYEASFLPVEKRVLPLLPTLQVLQSHLNATGEDLSPRCNVSKTSLASIRSAKKRASLDLQLKAVEFVKQSTNFKIKRSDPELPGYEYDEEQPTS